MGNAFVGVLMVVGYYSLLLFCLALGFERLKNIYKAIYCGHYPQKKDYVIILLCFTITYLVTFASVTTGLDLGVDLIFTIAVNALVWGAALYTTFWMFKPKKPKI